MKRWIIFLTLAAAAVLAGVLWWAPSSIVVERSDGVRIRLHQVWVGTNGLPHVPRSGWERPAAMILPARLEEAWLPPHQPTGRRRFISSHVNLTNALQLWVEATRTNGPVSIAGNTVWIEGPENWLMPYGDQQFASRNYNPLERYTGLTFGHYPRWAERLRVHFSDEAGGGFLDGSMDIENPLVVTGPERWALSVDRTVTANGAVFRLVELTPVAPAKMRFANWWTLPGWHAVVTAEEDGLTNVWHHMHTEFLDNYGNSSLSGLLPLSPGATNELGLQWKVRAWMCAEQRSPSAGDVFWESPMLKVPREGEAIALTNRFELSPGLIVQLGAFAGVGVNHYTNGVWGSVEPPPKPRPKRQQPSLYGSGIQSDSHWSYTTTLFHPSIVVTMTGATDEFYLSCRFVHPRTGQQFWLRRDVRPWLWPYFTKGNGQIPVVFSGQTLDQFDELKLIIGIHRARPIDFVIEPPEHDRQAGTKVGEAMLELAE